MTKDTITCPKCCGTGSVLDPRAQGMALRLLREKKNIPLREMSERMDISSPYLSDLELGRRDWNTDLIERYNAALKKG
jgi:predicted transcriptional regulator